MFSLNNLNIDDCEKNIIVENMFFNNLILIIKNFIYALRKLQEALKSDFKAQHKSAESYV